MSTDEGTTPFYYRVATPEGGIHSGIIDALSIAHAERTLVKSGLRPLRIQGRPIIDSWLHREIGGIGARRLGSTEVEAICRELALLLNAGLSLVEALGVMHDAQSPRLRTARFLGAIRNALRLGHSLASAIRTSGIELPPDFIPVVSAGEQSGKLPAALSILAEGHAESVRFNRAVVAAVAYPTFLLLVSIAVLGIIAFVVAPSLATLFASMDKPVPLMIAMLSGIATFLQRNAIPLGASASIAGVILLQARKPAKRLLHMLLFRMPGTRDTAQWVAGRRFASTLRLHLMSGVPFGAALPAALDAAGFPVSSERLNVIVRDVRAGGKLATSIGRADLLPRKLIQMMEIGESSGRLPDVLASTLSEARNKVEQRLALVTAVAAPILILLIGGLVGTIVFSVFSALLQINEVVS